MFDNLRYDDEGNRRTTPKNFFGVGWTGQTVGRWLRPGVWAIARITPEGRTIRLDHRGQPISPPCPLALKERKWAPVDPGVPSPALFGLE